MVVDSGTGPADIPACTDLKNLGYSVKLNASLNESIVLFGQSVIGEGPIGRPGSLR